MFQHGFVPHLNIHCSLSLLQSLVFKSLLPFGATEQSKFGWLTVEQIYKFDTLGYTVPSLYTHRPPWIRKRSRIKSKKEKKGLEKVLCSLQTIFCVFFSYATSMISTHSRYVISIWWLTNWMNSPHIDQCPCFSIWFTPCKFILKDFWDLLKDCRVGSIMVSHLKISILLTSYIWGSLK